MSAVTALGRGDVKHVRRDSMMQFLLIYPLILGMLLRWLIPWVTDALQDTFDLTPYHLLLTSFFGLLIVPQLTGLLIGFLLLDERDQNTLTALMVTPLSMRSYALYRVITPSLIAVLGILVLVPFIGIAVMPVVDLLPLALNGALIGPIFALLLASLANNKVEGIAIMKGLGIFLLAPFGAWWVPEPWQWILGIFPTFWPVKGYWLAAAGAPYLWVVGVGMVYSLSILSLLLLRFQRSLYQSI